VNDVLHNLPNIFSGIFAIFKLLKLLYLVYPIERLQHSRLIMRLSFMASSLITRRC
jgi:hypothetical protein